MHAAAHVWRKCRSHLGIYLYEMSVVGLAIIHVFSRIYVDSTAFFFLIVYFSSIEADVAVTGTTRYYMCILYIDLI